MRKFAVSVVAIMAAAGVAWALQVKGAVNETCPVKGTPIKNVSSTYKGKIVGFC